MTLPDEQPNAPDPADRYALVLDRVYAGVVVHGANTEIIYANALATELLGLSYDRMLGTVVTSPDWRFFAEDGSPLPIEQFPVVQALQRKTIITNMTVGIRRPADEKIVWAMGNAFPVLDAAGEIVEVVVSFVDITGLKEAQRALQSSEERLQLVLQGSTDAPWDWDLVTNELYYSPRWWQMLGYQTGELDTDATLWSRLMHQDDLVRVTPMLGGFLADGVTSYEIEFRLRHKNGQYVRVLSRGLIQRDAGGVPIRVSGTNTDITERHAIEQRLQQTQKMEVIGQLAGGVAHDFNNLLAVITGNLELLRIELEDGGLAHELLGEAFTAAQKGADLTRRLLASTRQQALQPTTVNVESTITNLAVVLRRLIGEPVRIETAVAPRLSQIRIDGREFENSLINLAINARDAMPEGGVLALGAEDIEFSDETLPAELGLPPGRYVRVSIADNGSGMTRDVIQHAIDPFFTTKPVGRGTGLGLSMVDGFVRQSGGSLKIQSEKGIGTTVHLYLPTSSDPASQVDDREDDLTQALVQRDEVVLVVEDDPSVRRYCVRCLQSLGYRTIEVADGPAAITALREAQRVDLLLTDVILPNGMSGPDVVAAARPLRPDLPSLFMSGYLAHMLDISDQQQQTPVLAKPFSRATLARNVHKLLDRSGVADMTQ